jgi:hypothetical protein
VGDGRGLIGGDVLDRAEGASNVYLDELLAGIRRRGLDAAQDLFRFAEVGTLPNIARHVISC